jgi:hypothetical protein
LVLGQVHDLPVRGLPELFDTVIRVKALQGLPSIGAKWGEEMGGWIEDQIHEHTEETQ